MPASRVTSKNPWHLILLLDDSGSMAGAPSQSVNEALKELIDALITSSMGQKPYFRVSVVKFGSGVTVLSEACSEIDLDEDRIASLDGSSGSTNVAVALLEALRILQKHPGTETDFEPFVFLLSDGHPDQADLALQAADLVKELTLPSGRPRIVTLGFGGVDDDLMTKIASNAELYRRLTAASDVIKFLPSIGTIGTMAGGAEDVQEAIMKL